jgi:hypothetical protein
MFSTLHEALVDNLARIIFSCLDVNRFLHNGIGTAAQSFSCSILPYVGDDLALRLKEV